MSSNQRVGATSNDYVTCGSRRVCDTLLVELDIRRGVRRIATVDMANICRTMFEREIGGGGSKDWSFFRGDSANGADRRSDGRCGGGDGGKG